ncbi:MAG: type II toxin-antitoxin system YafQ family toxin [Cyanobacteriota bacterium]
MLEVIETTKFKKGLKKIKHKVNEVKEFNFVLEKLKNNEKLDEKYKDHQLKGNLKDFRDCHIQPDLLLLYKIENNALTLVAIGSHSELF